MCACVSSRCPRRHPLFPLLTLLFEKCEQATQGSECITSASFDVDIENFVHQQEQEHKAFFSDDPELDNLVKTLQPPPWLRSSYPLIPLNALEMILLFIHPFDRKCGVPTMGQAPDAPIWRLRTISDSLSQELHALVLLQRPFFSLLSAAPTSRCPAPLAVQVGGKEKHRSQKVWSRCSEDWSPSKLVNLPQAASQMR